MPYPTPKPQKNNCRGGFPRPPAGDSSVLPQNDIHIALFNVTCHTTTIHFSLFTLHYNGTSRAPSPTNAFSCERRGTTKWWMSSNHPSADEHCSPLQDHSLPDASQTHQLFILHFSLFIGRAMLSHTSHFPGAYYFI